MRSCGRGGTPPIRPDGKRHARNAYAHSEDKCEKLLSRDDSTAKSGNYFQTGAAEGKMIKHSAYRELQTSFQK